MDPLYLETPLLKSRKLSKKMSSNVWLKLENCQNSGSFKVRGLGNMAQKVSKTMLKDAELQEIAY